MTRTGRSQGSRRRREAGSTHTPLQKNAQGDIVEIYDKQGALQAQYVYDTWGKLVSVQDADGNAITDLVALKEAQRH